MRKLSATCDKDSLCVQHCITEILRAFVGCVKKYNVEQVQVCDNYIRSQYQSQKKEKGKNKQEKKVICMIMRKCSSSHDHRSPLLTRLPFDKVFAKQFKKSNKVKTDKPRCKVTLYYCSVHAGMR